MKTTPPFEPSALAELALAALALGDVLEELSERVEAPPIMESDEG